jgi:hypothetical protein
MQVDLDRERKLMTRIWAKREEQLRGVLDSSSGLYGDLQGITGRVMIEIDGLEPLLIDGNSFLALDSNSCHDGHQIRALGRLRLRPRSTK